VCPYQRSCCKKPPILILTSINSPMATAGSGENVLEGFVHVMTEESFRDVLTELDTITDLTEYLAAKESFAHGGTVIVCEGTESNLLGWYLAKNRTFPAGMDLATFDATIWPGLQNDPAFKRRKEADQVGYAWDRLVDALSDPDLKPNVIAYWFIGDDRIVNSQAKRIIYGAWNRLGRGRSPRWAYVFLQTGSEDGAGAALARIQNVLDSALPAFQPVIRGH